MPAISPDGSQVAFAYSGGPHPGIYIALIGGEKPLQLTQGEATPIQRGRRMGGKSRLRASAIPAIKRSCM